MAAPRHQAHLAGAFSLAGPPQPDSAGLAAVEPLSQKELGAGKRKKRLLSEPRADKEDLEPTGLADLAMRARAESTDIGPARGQLVEAVRQLLVQLVAEQVGAPVGPGDSLRILGLKARDAFWLANKLSEMAESCLNPILFLRGSPPLTVVANNIVDALTQPRSHHELYCATMSRTHTYDMGSEEQDAGSSPSQQLMPHSSDRNPCIPIKEESRITVRA